MRYAIILILTIGALISCTQKKEIQISQPVKLADSFFLKYGNEGPHKAVRRLLATNKYFSSQVTDTVGIKLERLSKNNN
jgi:hypothetical protein